MRLSLPSDLNTRVVVPVILALVLLVTGFALVGLQTLTESTEQTLQDRLVIAQVTADRVDDFLGDTTRTLQVLVNESDLDPERPASETNQQALQRIYSRLDGIAHYAAMVNLQGMKVWSVPYRADIVGQDVSQALSIQKILAGADPIITKVFTLGEEAPSSAILIGIKGPDGAVRGLVCVALDLRHPRITGLLNPVGLGETGHAEIVDQNGIVLGTTRLDRLWTNVDRGEHFAALIQEGQTMVGRCHDCHSESNPDERQEDVVAFAPLTRAPWGVAVRQRESEAMAYNHILRERVIVVGAIAILISVIVAWLVARRLIKPMRTLADACREIAAGDLDRPIPILGYDEISTCARCVEQMRGELRASVKQIEAWNRELEEKVRQRTKELEDAERARCELLRKLVVAQEDERKRLARELHDETSQGLTALAVTLETATRAPADRADQVKARLDATKPMVKALSEDIHRIILDLRPAILDDFGLVQAIDWYAETRLKPLGIEVTIWTVGFEKRFPSEVETMVFRIAQEAITNIVRHAQPRYVNIGLSFRDTHTMLFIEDDGRGFDVESSTTVGDGRLSFGLMGMRERAALFGGTLRIYSGPGRGTRIVLEIPWEGIWWNGKDGKNTRVAGGRSHDLEGRVESAAQSL
jgi:signal transduction histidine kinase